MNKTGEESICKHCKKKFIPSRNTLGWFCSNRCQNEYAYVEFIAGWKDGRIDGGRGHGQLSRHIDRYIREKYSNKCTCCGWSRINPVTGRIPLHVHHKDGNSNNHAEINLDLLCPSCHSLTPNHGCLNKGKGRKSLKNQIIQDLEKIAA